MSLGLRCGTGEATVNTGSWANSSEKRSDEEESSSTEKRGRKKRKQLVERRCHPAMMIMTSGPGCQLQRKILHHNVNNSSRLGSQIPGSFNDGHVFTSCMQIIKLNAWP